jgi:hypothetical protein
MLGALAAAVGLTIAPLVSELLSNDDGHRHRSAALLVGIDGRVVSSPSSSPC